MGRGAPQIQRGCKAHSRCDNVVNYYNNREGMIMANLKPGDRVRLRSGGPLMTVHSINGNLVDCQWFTVDGVLQSATFPDYMLMTIEGAGNVGS